jgi:hypothetical protein
MKDFCKYYKQEEGFVMTDIKDVSDGTSYLILKE